MSNKKRMKIVTKDGLEKEYTILYAFKLASTGKNYIIYTDEEDNNAKEMEAYAAIYYPYDDTRLDEITSKEEWDAVNSVIESIQEGENE